MVPLDCGFAGFGVSCASVSACTLLLLARELMLVGRVTLPFAGIRVVSEVSDSWVDKVEFSSKLSSGRGWPIAAPLTGLLAFVARAKSFPKSSWRRSRSVEKMGEVSSLRNEGISHYAGTTSPAALPKGVRASKRCVSGDPPKVEALCAPLHSRSPLVSHTGAEAVAVWSCSGRWDDDA